MIRILIFSFVLLATGCSAQKGNLSDNGFAEFSSILNCSGRGGRAMKYKCIKKDSTTVVKSVRNSTQDTLKYKTDINKWETLNSLIDFDEFKKEMESVGGNNHTFDGCNNTFTIKTTDSVFSKYNSKIKSEKLKRFYELYDQM